MIQVLCYTGRGFDTCWRPASVATQFVECCGIELDGTAPFCWVRFFTGDFA